jgi:hypothetical protein
VTRTPNRTPAPDPDQDRDDLRRLCMDLIGFVALVTVAILTAVLLFSAPAPAPKPTTPDTAQHHGVH